MSTSLREMLTREEVTYAPGVWDGLTAKLAEQAGFEAVCSSGYAIAASMGMPDAELYSMEDNLAAVRTIREACSLPIVADIDTGYGNAVNVHRAVRLFERAGASAIFMEDQRSPKRCPACTTVEPEILPLDEAVGKVAAAVDARRQSETVIIARTDASGPAAMERAVAYRDAGADMIMTISRCFSSVEEVAECQAAHGLPMVLALTSDTWVERDFTDERLRACNVKIALYPTQILFAATRAMQDTLTALRSNPYAPEAPGREISLKKFAEVIGFPETEELQMRFLPHE